MNKSTLAGAAMIAVAAVAAPAVMAWSQSPPPPPPPAAGGSGAPDAAGGPGGPGHGEMHHGWGHGGMNRSPQQACVDRLARRAGFIASIGFKLNLTVDQKPLWDKVVAATQAAEAEQRRLCSALPATAEDRGKLTVIERMTHREQVLQAQLQALQQTEPAVQALYQALSPEQKAILDHPFRRG
jgi:hypothetical protein